MSLIGSDRLRVSAQDPVERLHCFLVDEGWPQVPVELRGGLTKREREVILGYGSEGCVIVDSSALVAILLAEPGHQVLVDHLARAPVVGIGAPTLAETGVVLTAHLGVAGRSLLARLLHEVGVETIPYTAAHWPIAVDAFTR
jgi:hypothetical protein